MASVLWLLTGSQLRQRPWRPLLVGAGVGLGVALWLALAMVNDATLRFFQDSMTAFVGKARLSVTAGEAGFPEDRLDTVLAVPGVGSAAPLVEARVTYAPRSRDATTLVLVGIDFLNDAAIRSYRVESERVLADPLAFLNQPDSVILTAAFAREHALALGAEVPLLTALGPRRFVVRGLLAPEGMARAFGGALVLMDIDGARLMLGKEGRTDRIDIVPSPNADVTELAARIALALGPGYHVEPSEGQAESFARMTRGYQAVLSFSSVLALWVALLLAGNSMTIAVQARRRHLALLRLVGGTRGLLLRLVLVEAVPLGLLGGLLGVGLGALAARLLVGGVAASMSIQYGTPIRATELVLDARRAALALGLGVLVSVLAAIRPAWRATRVPTLAALDPVDDAACPRATRRLVLSRWLGVGLLAAVSPLAALDSPSAAWRVLVAACAAGGAVLAAPLAVEAAVRAVRRVTARAASRSAILHLACDNLLRHPERTSTNLVGVVVGLLLVAVLATVQRTFEVTLLRQIERSMPGAVLVTSHGRIVSLQVEPLPQELERELLRVPGVSVVDGIGVYGFRAVHLWHKGVDIVLKAWDKPHPAVDFGGFDLVDVDPAVAGPALFAVSSAPAAMMVSRTFVERFHVGTGGAVTLETPRGPASFRVIGVVNDLASPNGTVFIARPVYVHYWQDTLRSALAVQADAATTPEELRRRIDATLGATRGIVATTTDGLRAQLRDVLGDSFAYSRAIVVTALLVALLGLLNSGVLGVLARRRELAQLRALGMSRRQVFVMLLFESGLLGALGGVSAAAFGVLVGYLWLARELARTLGWVLELALPWGTLAFVCAAGTLVGVVAGLAAAERALGVPIHEALAHE